MENVLEEISFHADESAGKTVTVTSEMVHEKLDCVIEDEDLSRYIL